jgi:hypothetical protein
MLEVVTSLLPSIADFIRETSRDQVLVQRNIDKIRRALIIELRCNLELVDLAGGGQPDQLLIKEILALLQLQILQAVYGLDVDGAFALGKFDKDIKKFMNADDSVASGCRLPSNLSGQSVSDALDYLLRKGIEMKAIAALSDKAVIALSQSIDWRRRLDNYRKVLLFTISNLKTKSRKAKP